MDVIGSDPYMAALFLLYANVVLLTLLPCRDRGAALYRPLVIGSGALPAAMAIASGIYLKLAATGTLFGDDLLGAGLILEVGSIQLLLAGERLYRDSPQDAPDAYPSRCR